MRALLITGFTVCVLFVAKTNARTCESIDVRNKVTEFEKLRNCSVIVGYLQIVLFENTTRDDFENISFPELREITGFLFFYRVSGLRSIGKLFPNLSVIRGIELFNDYALIIYDMFHLQEIGLHNLSAILRGSVRIEKNTKLCYVDTVNWRNLLGDAYRTFMAMNQDPSQCPPCTSSCSNNFCWNGEHCHTLTPSHCHKECIKGCEGPSNDQCHVCRNLRDETRCVSKCPSDKFLLAHLALCITKEECREQNGTWWTFQGECINSCPAGYKNYSTKGDEWNCSYCGALCPKVCDAIRVESIAAAQRLKGCTHINGDLIIRIEGLNNIENELESNLGKIEQVDGYLKVYRSFSLRSLKFLKNLRVIHGKNLENSRYSVIVNNNQNLQNLWDWKNFKLEIKNGTFSFHYNSKLCLSEIKKLHEMSNPKVNYSSVDVSLHSNGDKFACNLVSIETKVVLTDPNEVNLFFKAPSVPDQASLIGYLIYYTEAQEKNISSYDGDACGDQGWRTIFVSHDNNTEILNHTITQLEPFTQYAFYISTAYSTGKGSQSPPAYFKTLSSDPSIPLNIKAVPAGSDSILITWEQPKKLNGILSQYVVLAYLQEDDRSFLDLRNYCRYPMQEMEKKTVIEEVITTTVAPTTNTSCCKKENVITEIKKIDDDFDAICTDLNSYGNTASDNEYGCASFTYHVVSNQPYRKYGRSSSDNMIIKKRQQTTLKPVFNNNSADVIKNGVYHMVTKEVNGNETKYTLSGLKHYSIYILLLRACNENRTEKAQCSSVVMLSQRSGRKSNADDIINPTVESVGSNYATIKWKEPENPNSVIITYHIEYRSVEKEYFKYMADCITRLDHENASYKYTIKPLHPGNYSVRIRAQSLAGYGNYTKNIYFFISYPTKISTEIHIAISVVVIVFIILAFSLYLWYRHRHQLDSVHLITRCNPDYVGYVEDEWEMDRDNIDISQELGQGTFGTVHSGMIKDKQIPCAVKTVHAKADLHDKMEFLNEASVMKSFNDAHHVVRLLGVVSRGEQPLVIMELMARGDLKTFLRSTRDSSTSLTCSEMYRMAAEIADGMAYLAAKKFVHRDLAARNCMVSCDHTVKIGDFGMTRDIYETDYYRKETRGLLPVRWMAPESLADGVFSVESDIWSYGIVLWEIATLAEQPYQGLANEQVLQFVIARGTLERPLQCPDLLYDIMEACWNWRLSNRPTFADIVEKLETHVGQDFKLVSFYHSREGEEFRMIKRQVNLSRVGIGNTMPAFANLNISARWTKDGDESSCYISNSPRSVAPSTSYRSSNGFMSYPLSSS